MTLVTLLALLAFPAPAGAVTAPLLAAIHRNVGYTNTARSARCIPQLQYHWYADDPAHVSARPRILSQWRWLTWQARHAATRCGPVAIGRQLNAAWGWAAHWPALYALWVKESGWSPGAVNPRSGACGIAQLYPCRAFGSAWVQIRAGLAYIRGRYGTPSGAWAHWRAYGWY